MGFPDFHGISMGFPWDFQISMSTVEMPGDHCANVPGREGQHGAYQMGIRQLQHGKGGDAAFLGDLGDGMPHDAPQMEGGKEPNNPTTNIWALILFLLGKC